MSGSLLHFRFKTKIVYYLKKADFIGLDFYQVHRPDKPPRARAVVGEMVTAQASIAATASGPAATGTVEPSQINAATASMARRSKP